MGLTPLPKLGFEPVLNVRKYLLWMILLTKRWGKLLRDGIAWAIAPFYRIIFVHGKQVWMFGDTHGTSYAGNSKYLYIQVVSDLPEVLPVFVSDSDQAVDEARRDGGSAIRRGSMHAAILRVLCQVAFYTITPNDIGRFSRNNGPLLVNLWHGMPIKVLPKGGERPADMCIATSCGTQEVLSSVFQLPMDCVPVTGEPRCDCFFSKDSPRTTLRKELRLGESKLIFYLPTFRDDEMSSTQSSVLQSVDRMKDCDSLQEALIKYDARIICKGHRHQPLRLGEDVESRTASRIIIIPEETVCDVQQLLWMADILITDYSSCYFDYLLLERPIIFYPYDHDSYLQVRGLYYALEDLSAGPLVTTVDELSAEVAKLLENPDIYATELRILRDQHHKFTDGESSKRVAQAVAERLQNRP